MPKRNPESTELSVSLRVEPNLMDKFRVAAAYDGRSVNQQLKVYMRTYVAAYEAKHGPITDEMIDQIINKKKK